MKICCETTDFLVLGFTTLKVIVAQMSEEFLKDYALEAILEDS